MKETFNAENFEKDHYTDQGNSICVIFVGEILIFVLYFTYQINCTACLLLLRKIKDLVHQGDYDLIITEPPPYRLK